MLGLVPGIHVLTHIPAERRQRSSSPSPPQVDAYHGDHKGAWSNKHPAEVLRLLTAYAGPVLGALPVGSVDTSLVLKVMEPLWREKTQTGARVRQQIEAVLDFAPPRGWCEGDNPARWRRPLSNLLPKPRKSAPVKHFTAMPYRAVPVFMGRLRAIDTVAARWSLQRAAPR